MRPTSSVSGRNSHSPRRLNPKATRAVTALIQSGSTSKAAEVIGISERSMRRWKNQPEFVDLLRQAQEEIFSQTCAQVRALASDAVSALADVLRSSSAPTPSKVRAAGLILQLLAKHYEQEILQVRMNKIEERLKRRN